MINITICDDEEIQVMNTKTLVQNWAKHSCVDINITTFRNAESYLFENDNKSHINTDIILLDIQMNEMDGISLAKKIRDKNKRIQIIFITGYPDFMSQGFDVDALHYLLKPIKEEKLFTVLSKALEKIKTAPRSILFEKAGANFRIYTSDITHAEIFSHTITLYLVNGKQDFNMKISDMEKKLGEGFFRCHRSYIVSMMHVRRVTKACILLDNGTEIPLSRSLYDKANQEFIKFN